MAWLADLAGKAENLLNNLDEQTGAALRNHNVLKPKTVKHEKTGHVLHPDPTWASKKRQQPRNLKKIIPVTETRSNYTPSRKTSPVNHQSRSQTKETQETKKNASRIRKSPVRKASPPYSLNNCPKTLVGDISHDILLDQFGLKHRRYSLPVDLEIVNHESWSYKMQNLEVENAMLKNELNVMNREVSDLLDRLRKTEDGNDVVNGLEELSRNHIKLENCEIQNQRSTMEKNSLASQLEQLKLKINDLTAVEVNKYKDQSQRLEVEVSLLKDANEELENRVKELTDISTDKESIHSKIENDLRHAQTTISDLQSNLERSTEECRRLEKDWETYKLRVKSMLYAKDNEIKALQDGINLTEDTKLLMEQLETLKEEREELAETISRTHGECNEMKCSMEQLEQQHAAAERVVAALRDALRDERAARNRAEGQCIANAKELKMLQMESGQTIASLRTALRDKESELNHLQDTTSSSVRSTETGALNVADYDVTRIIDNEKIHCLTETLVQKQGKIDLLMADNNMLKIQLEKMETKYRTELSSNRAKHSHSVVQVDDCRSRSRQYGTESVLSALSLRIAAVVRRYPLFRIFIIIYMLGLHLWVITVLLSSTPEDYVVRPTRS